MIRRCMAVAYPQHLNESVMKGCLRNAYDLLVVGGTAQGALQALRREIRPQTIHIVKPGVGDFPEHELALAAAAACAYQQIYRAGCERGPVNLAQLPIKTLRRLRMLAAPQRLDHIVVRGVIDNDSQLHSRP